MFLLFLIFSDILPYKGYEMFQEIFHQILWINFLIEQIMFFCLEWRLFLEKPQNTVSTFLSFPSTVDWVKLPASLSVLSYHLHLQILSTTIIRKILLEILQPLTQALFLFHCY